MTCTGAYATALDYAMTWLCDIISVIGYDDSGGAGNAFLTDTTADFLQYRVLEAGSPIYNATSGEHGLITGIATTILQTTITWDNGDEYWLADMSAEQRVQIEHYLDIAANDIHIARAASGGCSCTLSAWGQGFAKKLNIIDAAIWHECPCAKPNISDERRRDLLFWMNEQLEGIRTVKLELCQGETGSETAARAVAEVNLDEWAEVVIPDNANLRDSN